MMMESEHEKFITLPAVSYSKAKVVNPPWHPVFIRDTQTGGWNYKDTHTKETQLETETFMYNKTGDLIYYVINKSFCQ